jgi:thiol-disulfide isomerase/thioredoxin
MALSRQRREKAFAEALSFQEFIESMQVNREAFEQNYKAFELSASDRAFFAELPAPVDVLVLAHDWCGDVVANTPLFGKIESETGKLRLHILERDPHNTDIAALYTLPDGRNHIPTYIFIDQNGEELGVFIERPDEISALIPAWRKDFFDTNPELEGRDTPIGELAPQTKTAFLTYFRQKRSEVRDLEAETVLRQIKTIVSRGAPALV